MTSIIDQARKVLEEGNTILIIGVTPGNIGPWYDKNDSRLVFWSPDDQNRATVPSRTRLVVNTRFTDKSVINRVKHEMPEGATFYSETIPTGQLKKLLKDAYVPPKGKTSAQQGGNGGVEVAPAEPAKATATPSDPVRIVAEFTKGMPGLKTALDDLLTLNYRQEKEIESLHQQLAASEQLVGELDLYREELDKVTASRDELKVELAHEKSRAAEAEDLKKRLANAEEEAARALRQLAEKTEATQKLVDALAGLGVKPIGA